MHWIESLSEIKPGRLDDVIIWVTANPPDPTQLSRDDSVDIGQLGGDHSRRRLIHRHMLRILAAKALGVQIDCVRLRRHGGGGISISQPKILWASCSSSDIFHAVAVGRRPVGVDIEALPLQGEIPFEILHPLDRNWLSELSGIVQQEEFLKLWTHKEAHVKSRSSSLDEMLSFDFGWDQSVCSRFAEYRRSDCHIVTAI